MPGLIVLAGPGVKSLEDCHQLAFLLPPSLDSFGGQSDPVLHRLGVARVIALEGVLSKCLQLVI